MLTRQYGVGLEDEEVFLGNKSTIVPGAVLLKNEERRQSVMLLFSNFSTAPNSVVFDTICKTVKIQDDTVYLLDTGEIRGYSFAGKETSLFEIQDAYEKILRNGKYFYLLGYDKIHRTGIN